MLRVDKFVQQLVCPPQPGWSGTVTLLCVTLGWAARTQKVIEILLPFGDGWQGQQVKSLCIVNAQHTVLNIPLLAADTLPHPL